jgi:hypothetical protein
MSLVILKYPFMRHYAGSVFDLEENNDYADWEFEERVSPKLTYIIPDAGKGYAAELDKNDTILCPPSVLEGINLTTGPCRITSAMTQSNKDLYVEMEWRLSLEKNELFAINGIEKQGIKINIPQMSPTPQRLHIINRTDKTILKDITIGDFVLSLDFSCFNNGFYEIIIFCKNDIQHKISCIKCFPLVITLDKSTGEYTTMKTIW